MIDYTNAELVWKPIAPMFYVNLQIIQVKILKFF